MEHAVPSCAEKGGTQKFHKKSMEILWNSFTIFCELQMILQLAESISAVTQILPLVEKSPKKKSPGAKCPDKLTANWAQARFFTFPA